MSADTQTIRLEIDSVIERLDLVQLVTDHVGRTAGLDEEALYSFGMAVRECVANAILHGNGGKSAAVVSMEFTMAPGSNPSEIIVRVRDRGEGFDPNLIPDPLAPENILRTSGRGVFLMRQYMDDVSIEQTHEGGTEVRMTKRIPS